MKELSYSELIRYNTYEDRFNYLKKQANVGEETFGMNRFLNQAFYQSREWREARRRVIIRDNANDMGLEGYPAGNKIVVHHMNPISERDVEERNPKIFDPEYLICVSYDTHNALHYGSGENYLNSKEEVERYPNDQVPWK